MIASSSTKAGFGSTAHYLEHGEGANYTEDSSERVAWTERRNLLSRDRAGIVREMDGVAQMNEQARKNCYHLVISWNAGDPARGIAPDRPTRAQMTEAADEALGALGLEEHQAWIVAHKDGGADHVHVMVNRVHPLTGRAWGNQWDVPKLWDVMRRQEARHGFRVAGPETIQDFWEQRRLGTFESERAHAAKRRPHARHAWEGFHEMSFREAADKLVGASIAKARGWAEVEAALAEYDLHLEPRYEQGMVMATGEDYLAMSTVRPAFSRPKLEMRFGQTWEEYQQRRALRDTGLAETSPAKKASFRAEHASLLAGEDSHLKDHNKPRTPMEVTESKERPERKNRTEPREREARTERADPAGRAPVAEGTSSEHAPSEDTVSERTVSENASGPRAGQSEEERALTFAARYYREQLKAAGLEHPARRYLEGRAVGAETEKAFDVGFAPDKWNGLTDAARQKGISGGVLERAGLAHARKDGKGHFDRFRGRLMFPMTSEDGQVSGFGARRIEGLNRVTPTLDGNPKYTNSPESEVFHKKQEVFGLAQAKESIRETGHVYVTEGYTDAMRMREAGYPGTVALAGARMTDEHAERLERTAGQGGEVTFVLDGDRAGREGTEVATRRAVGAGLMPYVVELPEGRDADGFARSEGAEDFRAYVEANRKDLAEHTMRGFQDADPYARAEMTREALGRAAEAPTPALREQLFERVVDVSFEGESEAAKYYRYKSMSEHFDRELEREGVQRRPGAERRPAPAEPEMERRQLAGQSYDELFGKPALSREGIEGRGQRDFSEGGFSQSDLSQDGVEKAISQNDPVRAGYLAAAGERRAAEVHLSSAEAAFKEKLGVVYADEAQAVKAWKENARAHGEEVGRDSVVRPNAYDEAEYARPGGPGTHDIMTTYELEKASVELGRARCVFTAASAREEEARVNYAGPPLREDELRLRNDTNERGNGQQSREQEMRADRELQKAGSRELDRDGASRTGQDAAGERGRALGDGRARGEQFGGEELDNGDRTPAGDRGTAGRDAAGVAADGGGQDRDAPGAGAGDRPNRGGRAPSREQPESEGRAGQRGDQSSRRGGREGASGAGAGGAAQGASAGDDGKERAGGAIRGADQSDGMRGEHGEGRNLDQSARNFSETPERDRGTGEGAGRAPGGVEAGARGSQRRGEPDRLGASGRGRPGAQGADAGREDGPGRAGGARESIRPLSDEEAYRYGIGGSGGRRAGAGGTLGDGAAPGDVDPGRIYVERLGAQSANRAPSEGVKASGAPFEKEGSLEVGDYVQWKTESASRFEGARRIEGFEEMGNVRFARIEGEPGKQEASYAPVDQLERREPPRHAQERPQEPQTTEMDRADGLSGVAAANASAVDASAQGAQASPQVQGETMAYWMATVEAERARQVRGAKSALDEVSATSRWSDEILEDAKKAETRFDEKLGEIYARPDEAKERFDRLVDREGFRGATETVYENPGALGRLNGHRNIFGWTDEAYDRASSAAETLHRYGANHIAHLAARRHILEGQAKLAQFEEAQLGYFDQVRETKAALSKVYKDPEAALERLQAATPVEQPGGQMTLDGQTTGGAKADVLQVMKDDPAALGELRGGQAGWMEDAEREAALKAAPDAAEAAGQEATLRAEMNEAQRGAEGASRVLDGYEKELRSIERELAALPSEERSGRKAGAFGERLSPEGKELVARQAEVVSTAHDRMANAKTNFEAARSGTVQASREVDVTFGKLYEKPAQARASFERAAGFDPSTPKYIDASAQLGKRPSTFGALKGGLEGGRAAALGKDAAQAHRSYAGLSVKAARARGSLQNAQQNLNVTVSNASGTPSTLKESAGQKVGEAKAKGSMGASMAASMAARKMGREMRKVTGIDRDI